MSPRNTEDLNETRNQIKQCYSVIDVFCLPHPGLSVSNVHYDGKIKEIQAPFLNLLNYYISNKSYECIIGNCENYKSEIDYILKEYELITTTLGN